VKFRNINNRFADNLQMHRDVLALGKLLTPVCLCHQLVNLVLAKERLYSAAGKVTVGLASH